jgi:hypothetical protein
MTAAVRRFYSKIWSGFGISLEVDKGLQSENTKGRGMPQDQVFISYSYKDKQWSDVLCTHLKPYLRDGSIISWSDKQIRPGSQITNTKVAVLLVTPDFLASDFIHEQELGPLLQEAERRGVEILWVPVRASAYKKTALKDYQAALDPNKPLANMMEADRDQALVRICEEIEKAVGRAIGRFSERSLKDGPPQSSLSEHSH